MRFIVIVWLLATTGCVALSSESLDEDDYAPVERLTAVPPHTWTYLETHEGQNIVESRVDKPNLFRSSGWLLGSKTADFEITSLSVAEEILVELAEEFSQALNLPYRDRKNNRVHQVVLEFDQGTVRVTPSPDGSWRKRTYTVLQRGDSTSFATPNKQASK